MSAGPDRPFALRDRLCGRAPSHRMRVQALAIFSAPSSVPMAGYWARSSTRPSPISRPRSHPSTSSTTGPTTGPRLLHRRARAFPILIGSVVEEDARRASTPAGFSGPARGAEGMQAAAMHLAMTFKAAEPCTPDRFHPGYRGGAVFVRQHTGGATPRRPYAAGHSSIASSALWPWNCRARSSGWACARRRWAASELAQVGAELAVVGAARPWRC